MGAHVGRCRATGRVVSGQVWRCMGSDMATKVFEEEAEEMLDWCG